MDTLTETETAVYRQTYQQRLARQYQAREKRRHEALVAVTAVLPHIVMTIPTIQRVYLFGSITRPGQFHDKSDIDVAVVGATAVDYFAFWGKLETALPNWVIDLRDVSDATHFAERVIRTGKLLYERTHPSASG